MNDLSTTLLAVTQSVDFDILSLTNMQNDPLGAAHYLWVLSTVRQPPMNYVKLMRWASSHVRTVLLEDQVGRRRDESITSAFVAAAVLAKKRKLSRGETDEIAERLASTLATDDQPNGIPFGRFTYGAMLLCAASVLGVQEERLLPLTERLMDIALRQDYFSVGLPYLGAYIAMGTNEKSQTVLAQKLGHYLEDENGDYENQTYAAHALALLSHNCEPAMQQQPLGPFLLSSPLGLYIMQGDERLPLDTGGAVPPELSRLVKGSFLAVVDSFVHSNQLGEAKDGQRPTRLTNSLAFGGLTLTVIGFCWWSWGYFHWDASWIQFYRYFFRHDFALTTPAQAIHSLVLVLLQVNVFLLGGSVIWGAGWFYLVSNGNHRMGLWWLAGQTALALLKLEAGAVILAIAVNLFSSTSQPAFEHLLTP